jgi:hypothetical protein
MNEAAMFNTPVITSTVFGTALILERSEPGMAAQDWLIFNTSLQSFAELIRSLLR